MSNYNIGIISANNTGNCFTQEYYAGILDSFKNTIEDLGHNICFLNSSKKCEDRLTYAEQFVRGSYDGMIVLATDCEEPEIKAAMNMGIPTLTIDNIVPGFACVLSDNRNGMEDLVGYVIDCGHKRIAYITGEDTPVARERLASFRKTCEKRGVEVDEDLIFTSEFRNMALAAKYTEILLNKYNPPTCILYSDDYAAIGGINMFNARGLAIPLEFSLAGYDGIHLATQFEPMITTIKQDTEGIGREAALKLIDVIENGNNASLEPIYVPATLLKGRTVAKI